MRTKNIKVITILCLLITTIFVLNYYFAEYQTNKIKQNSMQLTSPAFLDGAKIPPEYTCDGQNVNPPLEIKNIPTTAKSLVLIMDDPDAPGGTWLHWSLWNIPNTIQTIEKNSIPQKAILGNNDFNVINYKGPCPPDGTHRYFFHLFALDTILDLPEGSEIYTLKEKIKDHIIDQTKLMGTYSK
jgi:hypothetical protein